jgi:alkylhydroperoxidase family enzyme
MARIELPPGEGSEAVRALSLVRSDLRDAIIAYDRAVGRSKIDRRLHELVRMRVAQINQCVICLNWRNPTWCADETLLAGVDRADELPGYTDAERVALEYTTRFCTASTDIDDDLLVRLAQHLEPHEIIELTLIVGKYLALGRFNQVLGFDQVCSTVNEEISALLTT